MKWQVFPPFGGSRLPKIYEGKASVSHEPAKAAGQEMQNRHILPLNEGIAFDDSIPRAAVCELAFVQAEIQHWKSLRNESAALKQKMCQRATALVEPRQGQMRHIGPPVGGQAELHHQMIKLLVQYMQRPWRRDVRVKRMNRPTPLEAINAVQLRLKMGMRDAAKMRRNIIGRAAIDLANKTQRDMELVFMLPARAADAALHGQQARLYPIRRINTNKESVHGASLRIEAQQLALFAVGEQIEFAVRALFDIAQAFSKFAEQPMFLQHFGAI